MSATSAITTCLCLLATTVAPYVWGDFELLHFYPRNWQTNYYRSGHSLLNYITIWQYWLWFTLIFLINIYFVMIFRSFNLRRADMRGRRSTGDKRRSAWPELFTCFFPLIWCLNLLNNSLAILNSIELNGSYAALTIQVAGFQWGWRYSYGELNYTRLLLRPIKVGHGATLRYGKGDMDIDPIQYDIEEARLSRRWLKRTSAIQTADGELIKSPLYQHGVAVAGQGLDTTTLMCKRTLDGYQMLVPDPLRLLRSTAPMVLPTRTLVRLLATAEDVTHSWALPGLGLKLDCVPGRLFVSFLNINREGVYYGQCSELCGWNHFNMPITLYALALDHFITWWELELHAEFAKRYNSSLAHYNLLNVKYK